MTNVFLSRTDDFALTFHEFSPSDPRILICFADHAGGTGPRGFGTDLCEKKGWNTIYVGKRKKSRFQGLSAEHFQEIVSPILDGRVAKTYGASAGGYAALYFGAMIDAQVLAASPRNSLHPIHNRNGVTSREFTHRHWLTDLPTLSTPPTIVYDWIEARDQRTVKEWILPAYPDAVFVPVYNAAHLALEQLKRAGAVSRLVTDFMEGKSLRGFSYNFPLGTIERTLDDGRKAWEQKEHDQVIKLLSPLMDHLEKHHLIEPFSDAAIATKNVEAAELILGRWRRAMREGTIRRLTAISKASA